MKVDGEGKCVGRVYCLWDVEVPAHIWIAGGESSLIVGFAHRDVTDGSVIAAIDNSVVNTREIVIIIDVTRSIIV